MVWLATAGVVSAGSVQTVDGRRLQGELQFAAEALSVTAAGASESIPLTNVLSAEFLTPEAEEPGGSGAGNGLLGFYFSNTNLAGAPFVRLDESIQFNWTSGEAAPGIPADRFSVVWCGEVEAPVSGEFRFSLAADDSATLNFLDNAPVSINASRDGGEVTTSMVSLEAGKRYPLKLVLVNAAGSARAQLSWSGPGISKRIVPKGRLYGKSLLPAHAASITSGSGLLGTYFGSAEFSGPSSTRVDPIINFVWSDRDPLPGFARTNLSVRWTGQVKVEHSEEYSFYVVADERARLWVDGKPLINRTEQLWLSESKGSVPLVAGERYDIRMESSSTGGDAVAKLLWSSASTAKTNIPSSHLYPSTPPPGSNLGTGADAKTPPGLLFRNGSFVACAVERATETSLRASGLLKTAPITTLNVARIVFQPISKGLEARMQAGRPGVLLAKGDFVDGDFRGFDGQRVKLSSILFGTRSYDVRKEAVAVVMRDVSASQVLFEVTMRDGSVLRPASIRLQPGQLSLQDSAVGALRIPVGEVAMIRRRASPGGS